MSPLQPPGVGLTPISPPAGATSDQDCAPDAASAHRCPVSCPFCVWPVCDSTADCQVSPHQPGLEQSRSASFRVLPCSRHFLCNTPSHPSARGLNAISPTRPSRPLSGRCLPITACLVPRGLPSSTDCGVATEFDVRTLICVFSQGGGSWSPSVPSVFSLLGALGTEHTPDTCCRLGKRELACGRRRRAEGTRRQGSALLFV